MDKLGTGFTLIELVIVLFIVGLLLSIFLVPLATRIEQQERQETQQQLAEIRQALYGFIFKYKRLPCPDCSATTGDCASATVNDGREDILSTTSCAAAGGNLPWGTLGVQATDVWGNRLTYRVSGIFADEIDGAMTGCPVNTQVTLGVSFSLCSDGSMTVRESAGGQTLADKIPAIIVSHGKNGLFTGLDETENHDNDNGFVDKNYSQAEGNEFDDMLLWISPHIMRAKLVEIGLLP